MTEQNANDRMTAIQAVVDRVTSWQDGATEGTITDELRRGFSEVGVDVEDADVQRLADAIDAQDGAVSAQEILGS